MKKSLLINFCFTLLICCSDSRQEASEFLQIPAETLEDKIHGGFLGQLLGNLNGLPHEMKYLDEPGQVETYVPGLPDGGRSDDDTDIEWIYVLGMQQMDKLFLPPEEISKRWKAHINTRIWCSNQYARKLMDLGIKPPLTGRIALNPWADFNISGQFICESFGLIAPAMPQAAARLGLHYTHVTIDGEPAQTTQLFTTMIATAFIEDDVERIVRAGIAAVDPSSEIHEIVNYVLKEWEQSPQDWKNARQQIKERYSRFGGEMRDRNGYELNTAATVACLLYGNGDFVETLRLAFNFGWDADNNAATCGTIIGVIKGQTWMEEQGWDIKDLYRNVTRDGMPMDETITSFADRLVYLARKSILETGGLEVEKGGERFYYIAAQQPMNVEPLPQPLNRWGDLRKELVPFLTQAIERHGVESARAAYYAICLDEATELREKNASAWENALQELNKFPDVIQNLYAAPGQAGDRLRELAQKAGLEHR